MTPAITEPADCPAVDAPTDRPGKPYTRVARPMDKLQRSTRQFRGPQRTPAAPVEDFAALLGLLVDFLGVFLSQGLHNPYIDGAASAAIGIILASGGLALAYESMGLLLGESASPGIVADVREIVCGDHRVRDVRTPLTMQLGPHEILLNIGVEFRDGISARDHLDAVNSIEDRIRARHPAIKRIFIEARRPR